MALVAYALCTVNDVKQHLFNSTAGTTYDTLIEDFINSCTDWIEAECGRRFKNLGFVISNEAHSGGDGGGNIFTKNYPIVSVTSFQVNGGTQANPAWESLNEDDFSIDSDSGIIYVSGGLSKGNLNYRITYEAGYGTVPYDLKLACIKMVSKEFDKRRSQGVLNESSGGASTQWHEAWQGDNTQDFYLIIRKYRRF